MFKKILTILLLTVSMISVASPLDDARNAGDIIELATGYVKAESKNTDIQMLAKSVNERRRVAYGNIAKKNGISIDKVASESFMKRSRK